MSSSPSAWGSAAGAPAAATPGTITDLAVWAVPFGLVGGRLYHVITDWQLYFGPDAPNEPIEALFIWNGGLGVWGAIALGGVGVWIGCRRRGISLTAVADTVAPGVVIAQGIGRLGNYFNQELFGGPTDLPWGLEIDPGRPGTVPGVLTYHPTFLYEMLWDFAVGFTLIWLGRRFELRHGRLFALYVAGYTAGRFWIEGMRVDPAHEILGLRLNQWTSIVIFLGAVVYFWLRRGSTAEESLGVATGPSGPADGEEEAEGGADRDGERDGRRPDEPDGDPGTVRSAAEAEDRGGAAGDGDPGAVPEREAGRR